MKLLSRRLLCLMFSLLLVCLAALPAAAASPMFFDVSTDDPYAESISYAVSYGLFAGRRVGHFAPELTINRAMLCTVLCRMAGVTMSNDIDTNLADVSAGQWYTGAVIWALSQGIVKCREDGVFGVSDTVSRGEACLALARYDAAAGLGVLPAASVGADGAVSEASAAIASCRSAGLVSAGSESFDPDADISRAELAQLTAGYLQQLSLPQSSGSALSAAWDSLTGWSGEAYLDFPLSQVDTVTYELVNWLNARILNENVPAKTAAPGRSIDGNARYLTNYGSDGAADCVNVTTCLSNAKNGVAAGISLTGRQEYYGYSLQVSGVSAQDRWHRAAQAGGKSPWQCTWWAWGRAAQYLELAHGKDFTALCGGRSSLGNGGDYYSSLKPYFLSDQTPSANSIISWRCGTYGHVAYVEAVDEGGIWVSMADSGHAWRGVTYIVKTSSSTNPYPLNWYASERLNGFNHLDYAADGSAIS